MAKRELHYRGHTIEELQSMPLDDVMKFFSSRARRSLKRGLDEQQTKLLEAAVEARKTPQKKPIRTHCRDMVILPEMAGLRFGVYNGKEFVDVEVNVEMLGKFLGEFALCRRTVKHSAPGVGATRSSLFVPIK
ncbi:MAG: 30S ribosomal protein S19 [Candidatus Altiarchaeota archaeon]